MIEIVALGKMMICTGDNHNKTAIIIARKGIGNGSKMYKFELDASQLSECSIMVTPCVKEGVQRARRSQNAGSIGEGSGGPL